MYSFTSFYYKGNVDVFCRSLLIKCADLKRNVSDYRVSSHENKNKLLVIKNMISLKDDSVKDYINEILDEDDVVENIWDAYLQNLTLSRDFMNYKLTKMKKLGAQIEFYVSDNVSEVNLGMISSKEKSDIYTILGVLLDNIIDALESVDLKLVSIVIYLENGKVCGEFANSFAGMVGVERIFDKGYSTKGEGHGYGLYAVKEILKKNSKLEIETKIVDNFFVQKFMIDLNLIQESD